MRYHLAFDEVRLLLPAETHNMTQATFGENYKPGPVDWGELAAATNCAWAWLWEELIFAAKAVGYYEYWKVRQGRVCAQSILYAKAERCEDVWNFFPHVTVV